MTTMPATAIRPTDFADVRALADDDMKRVDGLIRKRPRSALSSRRKS